MEAGAARSQRPEPGRRNIVRFRVRTNASAMPFDCGLSSGVVQGTARRPWRSGGSPGRGRSCRGRLATRSRRQAVDRSEPVLNGGHHEVAHVLARDAAGGCHEAHGLPVAAVEGEGHAHALAGRSRSPGRPSTSGCCAPPRQCALVPALLAAAWRWSRARPPSSTRYVNGHRSLRDCGLPKFPTLAGWRLLVISRCRDRLWSFLVGDRGVVAPVAVR